MLASSSASSTFGRPSGYRMQLKNASATPGQNEPNSTHRRLSSPDLRSVHDRGLHRDMTSRAGSEHGS
ncbi:uncharacterized protein CLUP02_08706 [Colletotrichum lupini]|uniref:Uncharacterized protein n=4 Tax=Colletotrichum acutatum species complex TaxID=2707335 RepID=A0A9Q8WHQ6_9PEZI|nr:uncharacterized protein CLUP02_08706 [Colletotrichum lupini]XP_060321103.1 uncharacterized protein CCOS01_01470 [Colletotrichum costaricense]XP_060382372.1 uncharacterized protein CTAM01_06844 [Colletotrichum tamarilloi]KAK1446189.1 hypothetical protein CMEL01_10432 [Colletotrichum melonis]KAK1499650.1 hypothetical protein CTAM01_06844 [Colletotrichum tamarilloi]KAK1540156.1 hypothetical protein CCOS01_01470 [Colletotrichum costaricense]KAK1710526.1 hypothetical protein BDP67DRAFT_521497 [